MEIAAFRAGDMQLLFGLDEYVSQKVAQIDITIRTSDAFPMIQWQSCSILLLLKHSSSYVLKQLSFPLFRTFKSLDYVE